MRTHQYAKAHDLKHHLSLVVSLWPMSGTSPKSSSTTCLYSYVRCNLTFLFFGFSVFNFYYSPDAGVISSFQFISMTSQLKYENVEVDDHDDSSITEVEESLMGDEKQMHLEEFQQRYTTKSKRIACLSTLKEARWFLDTVLLLVIVGLLLRDQSQKANLKTSEREVGGDFTGVGPHCRELPVLCRMVAVI